MRLITAKYRPQNELDELIKTGILDNSFSNLGGQIKVIDKINWLVQIYEVLT